MVGTAERQVTRWRRLLYRTVFFAVGAVQCLLGVMFGVGLAAEAFIYAGEGPGLVVGDVLLLALDLVLLAAGLVAVLSALEAWEPPDDRWHGVRWPVLGAAGTAITVLSWATATGIWWLG